MVSAKNKALKADLAESKAINVTLKQTSGLAKRPPLASSPGQTAAIGPRTTASIRLMAVTTQTAAVQPTSMSISPTATALNAIAAHNARDEEPGPSFEPAQAKKNCINCTINYNYAIYDKINYVIKYFLK